MKKFISLSGEIRIGSRGKICWFEVLIDQFEKYKILDERGKGFEVKRHKGERREISNFSRT